MNTSSYLRSTLLKKNVLRLVFALAVLLFTGTTSFAQQVTCGTDQILANQIAQNPDIANQIKWFNDYAKNFDSKRVRGADDVKIIPVVFHVFHENGTENIDNAQILSQIKILNTDYRRLNPDTANLNPVFNGYGADSKVEFRIATLDPQGNCTNGIVRYYTPLTENANDDIKHLSVWPTDKYLNIWVVKSIRDVGVEPGQIIAGYAQFPFFSPGSGSASFSDGVIIRSDFIGNIGTSDNFSKLGRVATHEIGHWLGLFHPFQDSCFGGDEVDDTPPVASPNFGCSLRNSCSDDVPDLPDMIENFMDYANGVCQNIFTKGQKTRIDATLASLRAYIYSPDNLTATGTQDGAPTPNCAPVAAFNATVTTDCAGGAVTFHDYSYNAPANHPINSWGWSFPGGTPDTATGQTPPVIVYPTAGNYNVKLTVKNANGSNTATKSSYIQVAPPAAAVNGAAADMEGTDFPYGWTFGGTTANQWVRTTKAAYGGNASMMVNNSPSEVASKLDFISPYLNLAASPSKNLTFYYAYTPRVYKGATTDDRLTVSISTNCGKTWVINYNQHGTALNTLPGVINNPFFNVYYAVLQSDWRQVNVDLSSFGSETSALIRFEFTSQGGQNIFIDNINIGGINGIEGPTGDLSSSLEVFPNPVSDVATLKYSVNSATTAQLSLYDVTGRKVAQLLNGPVTPGEHEISLNHQQLSTLAQGTYFVELKTLKQVITKKIIIL